MPNIISRWILGKRGREFIDSAESEFAEKFLEALMNAMKIAFVWVKDFRKNIKDFNAKYFFKSRDEDITVSAIFENGKMIISEKKPDDPNVTIVFRNAKTLRDFLLSPKQDILGSMLRQDITINGNLNYLYKFAYMAKRLQLMVTGKA